MKIVVDTNMIIAALIKNSVSRKIINHLSAELITINFLDTEIEEHKKELMNKSKLNEEQFNLILTKLKEKLIFIDDKIILTRIEEAKKIMDNIDKGDSYFIAAALVTNSDIWSDDKDYQKQNKVKIWKTEEAAKKLEL